MQIVIHSVSNFIWRLRLALLFACGMFLCDRVIAEETSNRGELNPRMQQDISDLQRALIREEVTGSNIVVVSQAGKVIYESIENSGKAGDREITHKTLFPIWSMSKPVTIVAMLKLHEQGLFDWEDPVAMYIPCFKDLMVREGTTVRPARTPLRIIDLMTHRSGYGYYAWDGLPAEHSQPEANQTRFRDLQEFCEVAARYPLEFDPGTDFMYGNSQGILGRLAEVLSGKSFYGYLKTAVFEPLQMKDTSFSLDTQRRERFQPLFINTENLKGFTHLLDELNYSPKSRAHFGGDGLISSPEDYSRFCEMLLQRGVYQNNRLVSENSLQTMTEVYSEGIMPDAWPGIDMGFSVFVLSKTDSETSKAPKGIYGWSGYHNTHFWIDPTNDLYVLFMTRAREFTFDIPKRLRQAVYGLKRGIEAP